MICEKCEKSCEELVTRQGFMTTFFCEFVCRDCFHTLENCSFEDYNMSNLEGNSEQV